MSGKGNVQGKWPTLQSTAISVGRYQFLTTIGEVATFSVLHASL